MIRQLLLTALAAGVAIGSAAAVAQQTMPSSPPKQTTGTSTQKAGQPTGMRAGGAGKSEKLDSIANGLNACQMKSESERRACMDQVIRDNGG